MADARILVVGSINMDVVARVDRLARPGETVVGRDLAYLPGGKGANQAVAAARLGAEVRMAGCVGDDAFGSQLLDGLTRDGIDVQHVRRAVGVRSGVAVICVDSGGQNTITVAAGANGSLSPADVSVDELWSGARAVLLQLESPLESVQAAVDQARRRRILTILDPAPVPAEGLPDGLYMVDVMTPNQTEAEQLTGVAVDSLQGVETAAEMLQRRGVRNVVLKLGAHGAYWRGPDGDFRHVRAPKTKVVDTTAAGDAFNSALAVALSLDLPFDAALEFACAAGSLACTRPGAQQAMPTREEVDALLAAIAEGAW